MSYLSRPYYKVLNEDANFLPFFVIFFIDPMHGHKSENKWLGPCSLYQNCIKNSNLKVYLLYKVPDMFKFNILSKFVAFFSYFKYI